MNRRGSWVLFVVSIPLALILQLVALPGDFAPFRPQWMALTLVYWALFAPDRPVLLAAFLCGLLFDVIFSSLMGQHALALVAITFLASQLRGTLILFPAWQLTLALVPGWALYAFLLFWIDGLSGHAAVPALRWWPVVSTSLLWPFAAALMKRFSLAPKPRRLA